MGGDGGGSDGKGRELNLMEQERSALVNMNTTNYTRIDDNFYLFLLSQKV